MEVEVSHEVAVTVSAPFSINPSKETVASGASQAFSGIGGNPPYTFSIFTNNSFGTIDAKTGMYTAGVDFQGSVTDTVRVTDSVGNTADATITVNPPLSISPTNTAVVVRSNFAFKVLNGVPGYTFSILVDNSGGASVDTLKGVYTAGTTSGVKDTVRVTDADGNTADATVTVINPIQ